MKPIVLNSMSAAIMAASSYSRGEGEGGEGGESTFSQADVDAAVAAAVTKANDEASNKFNATKSELLGDLKKAKDAAKKFEGIDPDKVKTMFAAFENDQDLKDISEGRHEDVIKRRMEKATAEHTSTVNALSEERDGYRTQNEQLTAQVSKLMIDNNVVSEFIKEKGTETATADVILRANQIFKVENGDLIPRDDKGEIIVGKNGPMTINEWVGSLKEKAPHLFQGSKGAGGQGGEGGDSGSGMDAKIKAAAESGNMTEYRRLRKLQKEGKTE